jgi:alanyl aminopeptidase
MNMKRVLVSLLCGLVVVAAGCRAPEDGGGDASPKGALDGNPVRPTAQSVELRIDPDVPAYTGSVSISLEVSETTPMIQFHAEEMTFERVELQGSGGTIALETEEGEDGLITATADADIAAGDYTLEIDFSNEYDTRAVGLYRVEHEGHGYLFSQMQAVDARKAFPCWDEPLFKIPFRLTLSVPQGQEVITNTPLESESAADGWTTRVFAESKPMPTYLIAIAAGPLDSVPITGLSVPGSIYTVKGQSHLAKTAVEVTPAILEAMEDYFGRPYPYRKLDFVAIPEFWPGAMENVGLVTYADSLLLIDPENSSVAQRRSLAAVTAHELAHMWFGDLVTMEWWDDLWLNESFASWLGDKVTHDLYPHYKINVSSVRGTNGAMNADTRPSTKPVRKEVITPAQIMEDLGLAYSKGQAVLEMTEQWIGEEDFRKGVVAYINEHEWGSAEGADLWNALSEASGQDVASVMSSFLDQSGVPLIEVDLADDGQVKVTQRRFLNHGVEAPDQQWTVPVRLSYGSGGSSETAEMLLDSPETTFRLAETETIDWVMPNASAASYYRWQLPKDELMALARDAEHAMDPRERVAFLGNTTALLDAGVIGGDEYLEVLNAFAHDPDPEVVSTLLSGLGKVKGAFVPDDQLDTFAVYVRRTLGPALERFGLEKREGEDETVAIFRPRLIAWLGEEGQSEEVRAYATSLAKAYLRDPRSVDPALAGISLRIAALAGDRTLFETYRERFENAKSPVERRRFLGVLGSFPDTAIQDEALRYALEGPIRPTEIFGIPGSLPDTEASTDRLFDWLTENYEAVSSKLPPDFRSMLVNIGGGCTTDRLEAAREFFMDPARKVDGTEAQLQKVTDRVNDCVGLREREGAAVAAYLEGLRSES